MITVFICFTVIICVCLICFKGVTVHIKQDADTETTANKEEMSKKLKDMFEVANETDEEKDPTYKDVLAFIDETFGGNDYGNEPADEPSEQ